MYASSGYGHRDIAPTGGQLATPVGAVRRHGPLDTQEGGP